MQRIGTVGGAKEVKEHPYFHGTDWTAYEQVPDLDHKGFDCSCVLFRERSLLRMCQNWRARATQAALTESSQTSHPTSPRSSWKQPKSNSVRQASLSLASQLNRSESYFASLIFYAHTEEKNSQHYFLLKIYFDILLWIQCELIQSNVLRAIPVVCVQTNPVRQCRNICVDSRSVDSCTP